MALIHVVHFSEALGMNMQFDVILPDEAYAEGELRTLYLLHGLSDDQTAWQRYTSVERYARGKKLAVVMPDAHRSWYTDSVSGKKYFTYITDEIPSVCRAMFRGMNSRREDNYIAGLSMGGYGAVKAALTYPDRYSYVAAFSGLFDIHACLMRAGGYARRELEGIFGAPEGVRGSENDIFALAYKACHSGLKLPYMYLWCGTEDGLLADSRGLRDCLESLGCGSDYSESSGTHSWEYWDEHIRRFIDRLPAPDKK